MLDIPSKLKVESMIAVGYPDETKPAHKKEELQYDKVNLNQYGKLYTSPHLPYPMLLNKDVAETFRFPLPCLSV